MQNQKNVKGFIGLAAGLLSIVLFIAAFLVPTAPIKGSTVKFFGQINLILCGAAVILAIVAIVFGAISKKDADKKGPRKAGVIIGIIMLIFSLLGSLLMNLLVQITDYANNGKNSAIYELIKDNPESLKALDKAVEEFRNH